MKYIYPISDLELYLEARDEKGKLIDLSDADLLSQVILTATTYNSPTQIIIERDATHSFAGNKVTLDDEDLRSLAEGNLYLDLYLQFAGVDGGEPFDMTLNLPTDSFIKNNHTHATDIGELIENIADLEERVEELDERVTDLEEGGGGGGTAYEAGANIDITDHVISVTGITVPTKVSELANDAGYVTPILLNTKASIWQGTKSQYEAIGMKDNNTVYFILKNDFLDSLRIGAKKIFPAIPEPYVKFTSRSTQNVKLKHIGGNNPTVYYTYDGDEWLVLGTTPVQFGTSDKPSIYLRGDNPSGFSSSWSKLSTFVFGYPSAVDVSGKLSSLISYNNEVNKVPSNYCFSSLFSGQTAISSVSEDFLDFTELEDYCYIAMFQDCSNLVEAPALTAEIMTTSCYYAMFINCSSLSTPPALPSTSLASQCYAQMFSGCTALDEAPELPATTLAEGCYNGMFGGCTTLAISPELPATTLEQVCYSEMFSGCSSLCEIHCNATDISALYSHRKWVEGVSETGTFYKNPNMNDWPEGVNGIPEGWEIVDE